jgi:hypothetical protein
MNNSTYHRLSNPVRLLLMAILAIALTLGTGQVAWAFPSPRAGKPWCGRPFCDSDKNRNH